MMNDSEMNLLDRYLEALTEREGAAAALNFLSADEQAACRARIAELDRILDEAETAFGNEQLMAFERALETRRHNVADLIAHLERMGSQIASVGSVNDLLARLQAVENRMRIDH